MFFLTSILKGFLSQLVWIWGSKLGLQKASFFVFFRIFAQERSKSAQERSKSAPRAPQELPRAPKSVPRAPQERSKSAQERSKSAPRGEKHVKTRKNVQKPTKTQKNARKRAKIPQNDKKYTLKNFDALPRPGWISNADPSYVAQHLRDVLAKDL